MTPWEQESSFLSNGAPDFAHDWFEAADDLPGYDDEPVHEIMKFARCDDDLLSYD
ncbi:MAG: hypothetical protein KIT00_11450 [Rhodospirillales bacterium]|nr:hypothetical protein [Rhodospirillales bacterium]